jgi:transmembrane sensor
MKGESLRNMDEGAYRIAYLVAGYIRKNLTEAEHDELDAWVEASDENMLLFEELTDEKNIEANLAWMDKTRTEQALQSTKERIEFNPERNKLKTRKWFYSIAASVIFLIGAFGIYKIINNKQSKQPSIAKIDKTQIQPGGNKATLTLSNGTVINLVRIPNGLIRNDNGATINKSKDGEILYHDSSIANNNITSYNVLTTPKGGQYKVQLPDGSMVWLNASSSLKYPTAFPGNERSVYLEGEGYFEIVKDKNKPFKVRLADESEVKVLGTHFNVMAYEDEKSKEVTLLEGRVQIIKNNNNQNLEPGQQGKITEEKIIVNIADTEQVVGWKNGQFVFRDADIQSIMRQVARWYDVDVKYKTESSQHFNATIFRNEPVLRLLHILEETDQIHFKIKNKTIYVLR